MTRLISVYGDSISTFEGATPEGWSIFYQGEQRKATGVEALDDTWWMQVINHFGGELLTNAAWSGCVLEGDTFPQGGSERRIAALERDGKTPDDILIYIGINDYGWGSAYAQICGGSPNAPAELVASCPDKGKVAGLAPEGTVGNFAASYRSMLKSMHEKWPDARIWAATLLPGRVKGAAKSTSPRWFRGVCVDEYNKAIVDAATDADMCTPVDAAALGYDYEAIDGTHPTNRGMKQLAAMYIKGMEEACPALPRTPYVGEDLLTDDMKTVEFCTKPCVGCEYAKGTGNNWWHVCEKQLND